ncbi:hypothetical protein BH24BAC1_BH24BAC1_03240 [soil metagenome]
MSLLRLVTAFLLVGLLLTNCREDAPAPECGGNCSEALPVFTFAQLDRPVACSSKRLAEHVHYVINTKEHFEEFIYCNSHTYPVIDFSKYTLLVGSYLAPQTGYTVQEQEVSKVCGENKLVHKVTIRESAAGYRAMTPVTYYAVIPKLKQGIAVEVQVDVEAPVLPQASRSQKNPAGQEA